MVVSGVVLEAVLEVLVWVPVLAGETVLEVGVDVVGTLNIGEMEIGLPTTVERRLLVFVFALCLFKALSSSSSSSVMGWVKSFGGDGVLSLFDDGGVNFIGVGASNMGGLGLRLGVGGSWVFGGI